MNRRALLLGLAVAAGVLAVLAAGLLQDPRQIESPLLGHPAPEFRLARLEGGELALSELAGQPVVINFWATWCQPCIVEHPILQEASVRYAGRVHFVGIVHQDTPQAIGAFLDRYGAWGATLFDPDSTVAIRYGIYGAPETYFLDARGTVRDKVVGALGRQGLMQRVEALLAAGTAGTAGAEGVEG